MDGSFTLVNSDYVLLLLLRIELQLVTQRFDTMILFYTYWSQSLVYVLADFGLEDEEIPMGMFQSWKCLLVTKKWDEKPSLSATGEQVCSQGGKKRIKYAMKHYHLWVYIRVYIYICISFQHCRFGYLCQERMVSNSICHLHTPLFYRLLSACTNSNYNNKKLSAFFLNDKLMQVSEDGRWHITISVEDDLQTSKQWSCARRSKTQKWNKTALMCFSGGYFQSDSLCRYVLFS